MTITTVAAPALERFRALVVGRLGLHFDDAKLVFLAEVLRRRLESKKEDADKYLARLADDGSPDELANLAQELTVAETYFFRHAEQYRAFAEVALPDRVRCSRPFGERVSIVSAGCASGEEPYSLAMAARDAMGRPGDAVSILGVDINPAVLDKARRGRFSPWVLRETPTDTQRQWFREDGREFVLDDTIRRAVRFEVCNLADDRSDLWRPDSHDIVFCRNVLMYFTPVSAQGLVRRLARSLRPGGFLFLGHAETLRGLSNDFHLRHSHGTFYYQKRDQAEIGPTRSIAAPAMSAGAEPAPAPWLESASSWLEAIQRASDRIRLLVESPGAMPPRASERGRVKPVPEISLVLELLREERFADALEVVKALPDGSAQEVEVLLLHAVLLTHGGQLAAAERVCEHLLAADELNAEAHYLLALCREGAGDQASAFYHDQAALYLDPSFAMAHLHLGLLARRTHDFATARRELEQAIALLEREDASRLLLFGGGFTRDALVALCRGELFRSGGHA